jgi:C-terminal processing protease CtpA/Prc
LKDSLKAGVTKVIIDVRNNPGGDSSACTQLLEAQGMKAPNYGTYIRYSALQKNSGEQKQAALVNTRRMPAPPGRILK